MPSNNFVLRASIRFTAAPQTASYLCLATRHRTCYFANFCSTSQKSSQSRISMPMAPLVAPAFVTHAVRASALRPSFEFSTQRFSPTSQEIRVSTQAPRLLMFIVRVDSRTRVGSLERYSATRIWASVRGYRCIRLETSIADMDSSRN